MQADRIVFADIESIGLDPSGPIRQIAAVAVDGSLCEVESFETKLKVDWRRVREWQRDLRRAPPKPRWTDEHDAAQRFGEFLSRHATVNVPTSNGATLRVAQLAAHNAAHDGPFLQSFFERNRRFYPGDFRMLCTVQRALWYFQENKSLALPVDFKLTTLCDYFAVPLRPHDAHDALVDVRATAALYRAMLPCQDAIRRTQPAETHPFRLSPSSPHPIPWYKQG